MLVGALCYAELGASFPTRAASTTTCGWPGVAVSA